LYTNSKETVMTNNPPSSRIQPGEYGFPLKLKPVMTTLLAATGWRPSTRILFQPDPVTGQPLCEIASSGKRDIDLALDAAHKAKDKWGHTSVRTGRYLVQNRRPDGAESGAAGDGGNLG
jgi:aldehyde dehydrogenase